MKQLFSSNYWCTLGRGGRWAALLLAAPLAVSAQTTTNFAFTGGTQTYTVPAGVSRLKVVAQGGSGGLYTSTSTNFSYGALVQATVTVVPGEVLTVVVGGQGGNGSPSGGAAGYNGGGTGTPAGSYSGGGGGATDLRRTGPSTGDYLTTRNALLVAGGSGGNDDNNTTGGNGGTPNGGNGTNTGGGATIPGGTQTGPGGSPGNPGSNGTGGDGVTDAGGGGGGYYGGAGGTTTNGYSGGGGGSSFVMPTGSSAISYGLAAARGTGTLAVTPVQTNNALAFDGVNDYVALPASTPVPVGNSNYTIEAWIKPTAMGDYGIIGWGNYNSTNQVNALRLSTLGLINYWWSNDLIINTVSLVGAWHHVAATFDGTTRRLYLDGAQVAADTPGAGHAVPNANNLRIGSTNVSTASNPGGTGEYFPGSIDEVRVYSTGLTTAQIQADMFSTNPAVPGSQVAYYNFDQGTAGGNNAGVTTLPNLANANPGTLTNFASLTGTTSNWVRSFPTITSIAPTSGTVGTSVTVTGTNLLDATSFKFNGTAVSPFTAPTDDFTATVTVPSGATTGPVSVSSATLTTYNGPVFTVTATTAVTWTGAVSTAWATAGNWSPAVVPTSAIDVTIPSAPTNQPLVSGTQAAKNVTVLAGASLALAATTAPTTQLTLGSAGNGTLLLASGSTLTQGAASEIYITGNLTNNGATFALNATSEIGFGVTTTNHVLNGTAGVTFQTLTVGEQGSFDNLSLQVPVQVRRKLGVYNNSTTTLGTGGSLTLLSDASGTALVENGTGSTVTGTVTVQRYIDPSLNAGAGYRHYSAPVSNTTVADLATAGFSPVLTTSYNTSATPGTTTPFPTVFGYDQSRVTLANAYAPFDRGYVVPAATTTPLAVGQGYAVNIAGNQLVDFVGTLNNGTLPLALSRVAANVDAGWQLLGNPYPSPLDVSLVAAADRLGLDAASYVFSSTGPYAGTYRSFVSGVGGNSVLPVAQGFFVRVSSGQTSATVTFRNSQRLTAPDPTAFQRTSADPRPLVQLDLRGASGPADALYAYAQAGATPAFDSQFDAEKLANPTGLNLSSTATSGQRLAIDGRPVFDAATVLPLNVGVPAAGTFTFAAIALNNLPAGLDAYLSDAQTGQIVNLRTQPTYSFTVTAAQATTLLVGRFTLRFTATALATAPALTAAQVELYPNPAHARFTVLMPGVVGASAVQAELVNSLGQVVRRQAAALPASGTTLTVETDELAAGVYTLRLLAGPTTLAKRVVIH